jgi:hypothetical protein
MNISGTVDAPLDRSAAVAVDADHTEWITVAAEEAPWVAGRVARMMPGLEPRVLADFGQQQRVVMTGHTRTLDVDRLTLPLTRLDRLVSARRRASTTSAGSAVCGAGRPISADRFRGIAAIKPQRNSAASAPKRSAAAS